MMLASLLPFATTTLLAISSARYGSDSTAAEAITVPFDDVQGLAMVNAEVDGHRGRFVLDIGTPVVLMNRAHLQPNADGTLDTVRVWPDSEVILALRTGKGRTWSASHVTVQLGGHTIHVTENFTPIAGLVGIQYDLLPVEQYLQTQFLGLLGVPAIVDYETIIDFTHHRLALIPVDSTGRRLVSMPEYTPRSSIPILFNPQRSHWYVVGSLGGLPDTLVLDTGNNRNELNSKTYAKITSHVHATGQTKLQDGKQEPEVMLDTLSIGDRTYTQVPFYVSDAVTGREDTLGNSFFSAFGVIGFNLRTKTMIIYK